MAQQTGAEAKPEAEADRHARTRSIGLQRLLQLLEPLLAGTGITLLPLQVGPDAAELEAYSAALLPTPDLSDWERTAAVLERLLGVITVDTAVAHLAGSLGVPTALLLSTPCDWRWGFSGEHTPLVCLNHAPACWSLGWFGRRDASLAGRTPCGMTFTGTV